MARFILVHGAMSNSRIWPPTFLDGLRAKGHSVEIFSLPGQGEDETPKAQVTLQMYADRTVAQLRSSDEPAILVGHSMGGMVITQAADDFIAAGGSIARLVYLTAFLPRNGQSLLDLSATPEGASDQVQAQLQVSGEPPMGMFPVSAVRPALFNTTPVDVLAALDPASIEPQPLVPFGNPVRITDDRPIDRRYIFALQDRAITIALQRRMARDTAVTGTAEIDCDHMVMYSAPQRLIEVLDRFAHAAAG